MTTATMSFGMLPLALKLEPGAESRAPMAVVVIGGLLSSTLLAVFITPSLYTLLDDLQSKIIRPRRAPEVAVAHVPAPVSEAPVSVPVGAAVATAHADNGANGANGANGSHREPAWLQRLRSGDFRD
jgi:HAE1 family hydrophobic/amphiphilic exporter-1